MEKVRRFDPILTQSAKNVFGDIVVAAYVSVYYFEYLSQSETEDYIRMEMFKEVSDEIDNGAKDIVIKFCNGRSVEFTNSEWGCISVAEEDFVGPIKPTKRKASKTNETNSAPSAQQMSLLLPNGKVAEVKYLYTPRKGKEGERLSWWFADEVMLDVVGKEVEECLLKAIKKGE